MFIVVIGLRKSLRSRGHVMRPCGICARLTRHELVAIEAQKALYHLIPFGERGVVAELTRCVSCDLSREVQEPLGEPLGTDATEEELRKAAPKPLRVRGKRLRALHAEATERGAVEARIALLTQVIANLDEAWLCLPDSDRRTLFCFASGVITLLVGLGIGGALGGTWLTVLAIMSAVVATVLITAASWSAYGSRARAARKIFVPQAKKALATVPFDEKEVDDVLEAARRAGSPVASAYVLRTTDLANRPDAVGLGPYRA